MGILFVILIISVICFLIASAVKENNKLKKYQNGEMSESEAMEYKMILENRKDAQERLKKSKTIKQVMIVGSATDSRKKAGSAIIRGAAGGALLGPVGLVGGAMSGKNKVSSKTTFIIEYEDNHRETKEVDNNSKEFKELCKYIKM